MRLSTVSCVFGAATLALAGPQAPSGGVSAPVNCTGVSFGDIETTNTTGTPLPPSKDPWYQAPSKYECATPGQILKIRSAPSLAAAITNASAAYQLLYRTTSGNYKPAWAVTTLLLPFANASAVTNDKLLSFQFPYDSADVDASPSYTLYTGGGYTGDADVTAALGKGYVVETADYEGPGAFFTAGVFSGHATLDAVRAVRCSNSPAKLAANARYATQGYSGGALAGEWAAELAVQYAPELNFSGHALGGLTPNISSVAYTINGTIYAGLGPAGVVGILSQYPDTYQFLIDNLKKSGPQNATGFLATKNYSLLDNIAQYVGQNIFAYFIDGDATLHKPTAQRVVNTDGVMGYHGVPTSPLFVYKAIGDDISVIADTDKLINRYCEVGATIDYQRNTVGNHQSEQVNGAARANAFIASVLSGTYSAYGCTIKNVTVQA